MTVSPANWTFDATVFLSPFLPALIGTLYSELPPIGDHQVQVITQSEMGTFSIPQPSFDATWLNLTLLFVFDSVLGLFALAWARRTGFSTESARRWALFVLCFGLPGLLAFRLASDWPTRVRCPQCGNRRPLATEECPICHQPWPAPAATGIEILDEESIPT